MNRVPKVILLIESSRSSGRSLLRGIANYARHHGPWAFYWEPGGLEKVWPRLKTLDADGIILRDVEKVEEVLAYGLPAIVIGHRQQEIPDLTNVITDSQTIGTMAAEHLLNCGLKQFAYCGFTGLPWSDLRGESFSQRLQRSGYATYFYEGPKTGHERSWKHEQQFMVGWLKSLPKPIGLMACNDDRGGQVIEACKIAGLRVPDEVALVGADNDELLCELSAPPMSSIAINFELAGYESARSLAELMLGTGTARPRVKRSANRPGEPLRKNPGRTIIVPATHVVARQSTDILAVSDLSVAKALRFIREAAREDIHVEDVVKAAGLSRRVLEKRFRTLLGRSVLHEIRRVRVDQICRMLVETNQSVSQIAFTLGYAGIEHFARYFRKATKMTPLAYRKRFGHK